jgi:hypothetical protein
VGGADTQFVPWRRAGYRVELAAGAERLALELRAACRVPAGEPGMQRAPDIAADGKPAERLAG